MKLTGTLALLLATASLASSFSIRSTRYSTKAISRREAEPETDTLSGPLNERFDEELLSYLEKRRGGGGSGGGHSSSSSSSSGSSGSSSGSSSSGSSSDAGKSSSSGGTTGSSRNTGTASSSSSASRGYGGGAYYGGGSSTAYRSGSRSPLGLAPYALGGAALGFGLYGAYAYNYDHPYGFHNRTSNQNETLPIECLCAKYSACGCDDNNNSTFLNSIIGNGSASDENSTLVHVGIVNGTKTIIINGTLPNGTDTSANSTGSSSGAAGRQVAELSGYWVMGAVVGATVWLL